MTEHTQMPLVGPPMRRGWHEIVRFRPLTSSTNVALVVTRRGQVASVIPANSQRALSDYLSWPYDFREVDTRERLLELDQRLESCDAGYAFDVSLRLIYQVALPERVALDREDAPVELTQALIQSLRLAGRSLGVEQVKSFEEQLGDMLLYNSALVQRVQELGLLLRRADVKVALDTHARAYAEDLRMALRERPLHFQVAVESLERERSFDVQVGGAYRMIDRQAKTALSANTESAIQLAVTRTLRRIGITFMPNDYPSAASAMAEALRKDALLRVELSVAQVELLRPTVQIQPDRSMVQVPQTSTSALVDAQAEAGLSRSPQRLPRAGLHRTLLPPPEPTIISGDVVSGDGDAPPWAGLASASGRTLPLANEPATDAGQTIADDAPRWAERAPAFPRAQLPASKPAAAASEADDLPPWAGLMAAFPSAQPAEPQPQPADLADGLAWAGSVDAGEHNGFFSNTPTSADDASDDNDPLPAWVSFASPADWPAPPAEPIAPHDASADELDGAPAWVGFAFQPSEPATDQALGENQQSLFELAIREVSDLLIDQPALGEQTMDAAGHDDPTKSAIDEQIVNCIALLQSQGPAWFKMWALELKEQPERLPEILAELTANTDLLNQADDPRYQARLLLALAADSPPITLPARPVAALEPAIAPEPAPGDEQDDMPDWLRLRSKWNGNEGGA